MVAAISDLICSLLTKGVPFLAGDGINCHVALVAFPFTGIGSLEDADFNQLQNVRDKREAIIAPGLCSHRHRVTLAWEVSLYERQQDRHPRNVDVSEPRVCGRAIGWTPPWRAGLYPCSRGVTFLKQIGRGVSTSPGKARRWIVNTSLSQYINSIVVPLVGNASSLS